MSHPVGRMTSLCNTQPPFHVQHTETSFRNSRWVPFSHGSRRLAASDQVSGRHYRDIGARAVARFLQRQVEWATGDEPYAVD